MLTVLAVLVQMLAFLVFTVRVQDSYGNFRLKLFPDCVILAMLEAAVVWLIRVDWKDWEAATLETASATPGCSRELPPPSRHPVPMAHSLEVLPCRE